MFPASFKSAPEFHLRICPMCLSMRDASESNLCCGKGTCILGDIFPPYDEGYLRYAATIEGMQHISRELNNLLSFTSLGTSHEINRTTGWVYRLGQSPTMYALHGRTHHSWRNMSHSEHYYTFHPTASKFINESVVHDYRDWILEHNRLGNMFHIVQQLWPHDSLPQKSVLLHPSDVPTNTLEPFALMGSASDYLRLSGLECLLFPIASEERIFVPQSSSLYDTAQYPLLFPEGIGGWWKNRGEVPLFRPYKCGTTEHQKSCKSVASFVKYATFQRAFGLSTFSTAYQQWILDSFSRWQSMIFSAMEQDECVMNGMQMRISDYLSLQRDDSNGRPFMLPASIPGSPAYQKKLIADGMAVVAKMGKPTLFITFTANARWPEFLEAIEKLTGQAAPANAEALYPDLLVRIFRQKLLAFEKDLRSGVFFPYSEVYSQRTIEFQKRFIPHAHIIMRLNCPHPVTASFVDEITTTRLFFHENCPKFSPGVDPEILRKDKSCTCPAHQLHRIVFSKMRHTKCTERCARKDGRPGCKYGYPYEGGTPYCSTTFCDSHGYWKPQRKYACDSIVVPYNPHMMLRYNCHINNEICAGIHVVKYIRKYISKLPCSTRVSISDVLENPALEFHLWQKLRHIGVAEALVRLKDIDINRTYPSVTALKVHDEGKQLVFYQQGSKSAGLCPITPLMRYFSRHFSLQVTYEEYYERYILSTSPPKRSDRAYFADDPTHFGNYPYMFACERCDRHVARLDVPLIRDPEFSALVAILRRFSRFSWKDCKTVCGVEFKTYVEASQALGIYLGIDEYSEILESVINPNPHFWQEYRRGERSIVCAETPQVLRRLFVCLVLSGASATQLVRNYVSFMASDAPRNLDMEPSQPDLENHFLSEVSKLLLDERMSLSDIGLSEPKPLLYNEVIQTELERFPRHLLEPLAEVSLSKEQKSVVKTVCLDKSHKLFYLGAKAGRGKTRVANAIISKIRLQGKIVMIGCPSAKAATHYLGATTLHKLFGIPFEFERAKACSFMYGAHHPFSLLLFHAELICIDEFAMTHSVYITFIDKFLRFVTGVEEHFGGKRVLACGDFTQLSPVDTAGAHEGYSSPLFHPLFRYFRRFCLSGNFRQGGDKPFATFCNSVSEGIVGVTRYDGHYSIPIPPFVPRYSAMEDALYDYYTNEDFPHALSTTRDFIALSETRLYSSSIVAFHNITVNNYNRTLSERVSHDLGTELVLIEAHETVSHLQSHMNFATEDYMMHFDEDDSIPPHTMTLFVGAPVFLIRNFLPSRGLVNGAKFIIKEIFQNHIKAINVTCGCPHFGQTEIFFRFAFPVTAPGIAFSRRQFPFKLAFASTVHKLQGDTIPEEGLLFMDAESCSFCHAQVYVAYTRARKSAQMIVLSKQECMHCVTLQALVQEDPTLLTPTFATEEDDEKDEFDNTENFYVNSTYDWSNIHELEEIRHE